MLGEVAVGENKVVELWQLWPMLAADTVDATDASLSRVTRPWGFALNWPPDAIKPVTW